MEKSLRRRGAAMLVAGLGMLALSTSPASATENRSVANPCSYGHNYFCGLLSSHGNQANTGAYVMTHDNYVRNTSSNPPNLEVALYAGGSRKYVVSGSGTQHTSYSYQKGEPDCVRNSGTDSTDGCNWT